MQKIEVLVSIPAAGKSTYCRELMKKEPGTWKRLNNDDLRSSFDNGIWTKENEQLIRSTRQYLLKEFLAKGFSVLVDNLNIGKRNWEEITKIAKEANRDVMVYEKPFFIELEEAVERDSKRTGTACVGRSVIERWWKDSGKNQFKFYKPRMETYLKRTTAADRVVEPMKQDETKPKAIIFDMDGSLIDIGSRSPYDANNCHLTDTPREMSVEIIKQMYNAEYKIIFCSGRMEKDRAHTKLSIEGCLPEIEYELFLRKDGDQRKDAIIKEEIFNEHIKNKYWIKAVFDDRISVCRLWFNMGLSLFRIGNPDADF